MRTIRQWWTMFLPGGTYGGSERLCSKHASLEMAVKVATRCERRGGSDHRILEVVEAVPYGERKR